MKRSGFLLGLFSIGGQVLLLRELISTFNGDELFIGTALFGWLAAVAIGAYIGGLGKILPDKALFVIGSIILPIIIALIRLSPLALTDHVGEIIPFSQAAIISIIAMAPVGVISGWLFSAIVRKEGFNPAGSIGFVYLYEGIGAFVGGLLIALAAGNLITTTSLAIILSLIVITASVCLYGPLRLLISASILVALAAMVIMISPSLEKWLDGMKFKGYEVTASFDTPYSHQTILKRDETTILMTNSSPEAICPDQQTVENLLIPPLLYYPDASTILYLGRAELGLAQLADLLNVDLFTIDPRYQLDDMLAGLDTAEAGFIRFVDDPVGFLSGGRHSARYDIIIINASDPGSYRTSRLLNNKFLAEVGRFLNRGGIIYFPTGYDTDRYISAELQTPLSIIYNTLKRIYINVNCWPGNMTLFFASPGRAFDLSADSLIAQINEIEIETHFIHPDYLYDRLNFIKTQRLEAALKTSDLENTLEKPILPQYHIQYRSLADSIDRLLIGLILTRPLWIIILPLIVVVFYMTALLRNRTTNQYALFIFFIAGIISLSFELLAFYLYQSTAGSLYGEMAILIGSFMLGLAVGTFYSIRGGTDRPLEFPALAMLLVAGLIFLATWKSITAHLALPYYSLFLFVVALSTGTLFIGATNRYYTDNWLSNLGSGYAWEVLGSSIGALLTITVLLPVIGLTWLLWSFVILTGLTLLGAFLTARG